MSVVPAIAELVPDAQRWRRHLHANPELFYDVVKTADFVAERLREFGCDEVRTGVGRSGVVGVIKGRMGASKRTIGLRADMDALPIAGDDQPPLPLHRSRQACTPAATTATPRSCSARRAISPPRATSPARPSSIFQPAEEGGAGAKAMVEDGLMEDFAIEEVYALHNAPKLPVGKIPIRKGAAMAVRRLLRRQARRQGRPCRVFRTIASTSSYRRRADRHGAANDRVAQRRPARSLRRLGRRVSPPATPTTSCRSPPNSKARCARCRRPSATLAERRFREIVAGVAAASGVSSTLDYRRSYPVTFNPVKTERIRRRRRARWSWARRTC